MGDSEDRTAALAEVNRKVQPNITPKLQPEDVGAILDNNKRASRWTANTFFDLGVKVMPDPRTGKVFEVTKAGTSGASQPSWPSPSLGLVDESIPTLGGDGGVEYREFGSDYANVYDTRKAIRECFAMKLAMAAEFNNSEDGSEATIYQHLKEMVQAYGRPLIA